MSQADAAKAVEIVEEILTQHWSPEGCYCWVCVEGRRAKCRAQPRYMRHLRSSPERGYVHVDRTVNSPSVKAVLPGNGGGDI